MKKYILILLVLGLFFVFSKAPVFADCMACASAACDACNPNIPYRCKCTTQTLLGYASCSGVHDCSCKPSAPECVPTAVPTAVPTKVPTAVPTTSSGGGSSCSTTCNGLGTNWHKKGASSCPSGLVEGNCGDAWSGCTCCSCVAPSCSSTCNGLGTNWHQKGGSSCPSGLVEGNCGDAWSGCTCCSCVAAVTPIPTTVVYCSSCTGGSVGSSTQCSSYSNSPPTFGGLKVLNSSSAEVPADSNRNQICQTNFNGNRTVYFEITASDPDSDVVSVTLTWNSQTIPFIYQLGSIYRFGGYLPPTMDDGVKHDLVVNIDDGEGKLNSSVKDTSRSFKIWDCKVKVSGSIYDGTDGISCSSNPSVGFSKMATKDVLNFKSLAFKQSGVSYDMTVNPDGVSYTSGSNGLIWGLNSYIPQFNSDIALSNQTMKSGLNCNFWIDTTGIDGIDPYPNNPSYVADFSGIISQDPWWQANNGGVVGNSSIDDRVPVTCTTENCKISRHALVSAVSIDNTGRDLVDCQNWYYSGSSIKMANVNNNYGFFYDKYFSQNGVGITFPVGPKTIADIGTSGIYFVNGDLTIDNNKTIKDGDFLMIIVNGDINISGTVKQIDGILVADNIGATGVGDYQLVFNGSLFAFSNVDFSRGYTKKSDNNLSPAVVVNYDPQLLFKLPSGVAKALTSWQWGN